MNFPVHQLISSPDGLSATMILHLSFLKARVMYWHMTSLVRIFQPFSRRPEFRNSSEPVRIGQLGNLGLDSERWRQRAMIDTWFAWRWRTVQFNLNIWQYISQLLQVYNCLLRQFVDICCIMNCVQELFYTASLSHKTIDACSWMGSLT